MFNKLAQSMLLRSFSNPIYIYKTVVSVVCSHLSAVSRRCTPRSIDARATVRAYVNVRNESGRGAETAYAVTYCSAQVEEMFAVSFFKLREQFTFRVTKGRSDAGEHQSGETPTAYAYGCPAEQWQQEPGGSSLSRDSCSGRHQTGTKPGE